MARDPFHCLPKTEAGARMPSANTIIAADTATRQNAVEGSRCLLRAYLHYGVRHGLPNLSRDDCELALQVKDFDYNKCEKDVGGKLLIQQSFNALSTHRPVAAWTPPLAGIEGRGA